MRSSHDTVIYHHLHPTHPVSRSEPFFLERYQLCGYNLRDIEDTQHTNKHTAFDKRTEYEKQHTAMDAAIRSATTEAIRSNLTTDHHSRIYTLAAARTNGGQDFVHDVTRVIFDFSYCTASEP